MREAGMNPMTTAPKDGSRILVKVIPDEYLEYSVNDNMQPFWTIAQNNLDNIGVDEWDVAGRDWSFDTWTTFFIRPETIDRLAGWKPLPEGDK